MPTWFNSTTMAGAADNLKTTANTTWSWVYNNILFDKLDRFVYHGLMTSANWTVTQMKAMNLESRAQQIDWVLVGSMLTFFFITVWILNRMTARSPPPVIQIHWTADAVEDMSRMDGFTKPRRSPRIYERTQNRLDADILNTLNDNGVSARDLRKILLPTYPEITLTDINSRLYTMLNRGQVIKNAGSRPTWSSA